MITAATNGEDDTIVIPAGTFTDEDNGNSSFDYNSTENHSLTIEGAGAGATILKQVSSGGSLLEIYNSTNPAGFTLTGVTIEGADSDGLANAAGDGAVVNIQDCAFVNNNRNLFLVGGSVTANISGNSINGGVYGLYQSFSDANLTVSNNTFENMAGNGSALYISNIQSSINIIGNTFNNNQSDTFGGALDMVGFAGPLTLINNVFSGNSSDNEAGAVNIPPNDAPITVIGNVFLDNISTGSTTAGGLYAEFSDSILLVNNTFAGNQTDSGAGGVLVLPLSVSDTSSFYNNIAFGNTGDFADDVRVADAYGVAGAPIVLSHNDIGDFSSVCEETGGCTPDIQSTNNITADPQFIDLDAGNLNLATGSPAIGAGDPAAPQLPTQDLTGRTLNNPPDMGAFAVGSLVVSPLSLDFGNVDVGEAETLAVTLSNEGANPVAISGLVLSNTAVFSIDSSDCGGSTPSIPSGESCDLLVTFEPDSEDGFDGTLTINSDDSTLPSVVIDLSGTGSSGG
ncbi:MAG TPA: choice-of-anchor D domain-containing protein, partial [bacterium]|nr:choice-of-anchor D domain-containing protein [bacterium]